MKENFKNLIVVLIAIMLALGLFLIKSEKVELGELEIHFIDVGQGDSSLILLPNKEVVLIDAGKRSDGPRVVNYLKDLKIDRIDYLMGTHPHEDHIGGLVQVMENFKVGNVYLPNKTNTTKVFERLLLTIKDKDLKLIEAKSGLRPIDDGKLLLEVLGPTKVYSDINNNSIVLKLEYGEFSALFTGDMERPAERDVIKSNLKSRLLKVAHHGSDTSSSPEFISKVSPEYAIISLGKDNKYKHPSEETLSNLTQTGAEIFRTDESGDIVVKYIDGNIKVLQSKK